ncbi:hypothetical protein BG011_004430 [Mortierella polycephala]|uniref:Uncharacterized protein n=1 Tax=Mortierella polycephala TaxID=41804 RepID=A0A9P6PYL0_9FUNG|nr:hypothetical protein BG011_004430 [Mortierella polycephala]
MRLRSQPPVEPSARTITTTTVAGTSFSRRNMSSSLSPFLSTILVFFLTTIAFAPQLVSADIQCTQFSADTFRVGSTIKFEWSDTLAYPIGAFTLDLYCYENGKHMRTLASLDTSESVSPQPWTVDESLLTTLGECPLNQYQGGYAWTYIDLNTGMPVSGYSKCKTMLLVGPGVVPAPGELEPVDTPPADDPQPGEIEVTDRTKRIIIGVGCAVGVLILAGVVGFYYIRFKNKRAEQELVNKKLREPLQSDPVPGAAAVSSAYSRVDQGDAMELGAVPIAATTQSSSRPETPIAVQHSSLFGDQHHGTRTGSFVNERPTSLLTSSYVPPVDEDEQEIARRKRQQEDEEQQRQMYEQQLLHQQQLQIQQQQQQQQNFGNYPF